MARVFRQLLRFINMTNALCPTNDLPAFTRLCNYRGLVKNTLSVPIGPLISLSTQLTEINQHVAYSSPRRACGCHGVSGLRGVALAQLRLTIGDCRRWWRGFKWGTKMRQNYGMQLENSSSYPLAISQLDKYQLCRKNTTESGGYK